MLIDKEDKIFSQRQQYQLLGVNRSGIYYKPMGVSERDQLLMNLLDEQYTKRPFWGVRNMTTYLRSLGHTVGKDHTRTLLRRMGLVAIFAKPNLSKPNLRHKVYPYLLRDLEVLRPNQVWSTDITYIRLACGFAYLVAIMDWYSRYVLSWRLSNTLDSSFCIEALEEALFKYGKPEIFNSDQGSQFTSREFISKLVESDIIISMDGKGRCLDNIFVERLWRSVKYEDIYLHSYQNISEVKKGLREYFRFYNYERFHQSLDNKTPWQIYLQNERVLEYAAASLKGLAGNPDAIFFKTETLAFVQ